MWMQAKMFSDQSGSMRRGKHGPRRSMSPPLPSIKQTAVQMNMFFIEERDIETIASSEISSLDSFKDTWPCRTTVCTPVSPVWSTSYRFVVTCRVCGFPWREIAPDPCVNASGHVNDPSFFASLT
jgi:hypothetical protein